jgi:aliphatic nitrilase
MLVARDPASAAVLDATPRAESFFLDPSGEQIGDALRDDEGILYAEIDLNRCVEPKQFHDVVGYYNRFDVFDLSVNRRRLSPATFTNDTAPPPEASEPPVREEAARPYATARIGF